MREVIAQPSTTACRFRAVLAAWIINRDRDLGTGDWKLAFARDLRLENRELPTGNWDLASWKREAGSWKPEPEANPKLSV